MYPLGKRIVVVGVSASGKSTFARKLREKTGLPLILMDSIMWKPGWEYVGDEAVNAGLAKISTQDSWIVEGYITKASRTILFGRADTILYLDYTPWVCALRYMKRWWLHRKDPRPELSGSPKKFSLHFLKLVWSKGEAISLNRFLKEVSDQKKIVTLTSPRSARVFLESDVR